MRNFKLSLGVVVAAMSMGTAVADTDLSPYWVDSYGNYVRDSNNNCIRTSSWPKDNPVAECGDNMPEPVATVAPQATPALVPVVLSGSAVFESGSNALTPESEKEVKQMASELESADIASIQVIGHTDSTGPEEFNQKLSEKRAAAVRDALIADGINPDIVESRGMGESQPVADNSTSQGRAKNRRVEININASKPTTEGQP
jgi:OOP family OmpA-OmpF porin